MISDLDMDLNAGWHDSTDYRPNGDELCRNCAHLYREHSDEYEGCSIIDCTCYSFEP